MNHDRYPCKRIKIFNDTKYISRKENLTDITLNSFDDLVWLSYKSLGKLRHLLTIEDGKILAQFKNTDHIHSILANCSENYFKLYLIYKTLNEEQREVFLNIHNMMISSQNSILCINAGPGTGKTFIIASLAITCKISPCYLVYTRKLEQQLSKICSLNTYTNCKFLMDSLNMSFCEQKNIWSSKKKDGTLHEYD